MHSVNEFVNVYAKWSNDEREEFTNKLMMLRPELANQLAFKIQRWEMDHEYKEF